LRD
jgi:hypothetical protein